MPFEIKKLWYDREETVLNQRIHNYIKANPNQFTERVLIVYGLAQVLFALLADTPQNIWKGLVTIVVSPCGLITDYLALVGVGATFLNAGLVTLSAVYLASRCKVRYTGVVIASIFISGGFALFGKNIANIWPIYLGVYLYARYHKKPFGDYLPIAFFGTALGPLVSEFGLIYQNYPVWVRLLAALVAGVIVGFFLPPVSRRTAICHQGYNLYNVGFSAGLIGTVFVSMFRSFGYTPSVNFYWSTEYTPMLAVFLLLLFSGLTGVGIWLDRHALRDFKIITCHSGHSADYLRLVGFPGTMINVGLIGILYTVYILVIGGDLNGPTAGCILTVAGFGACGLNLRNVTYTALGVILGSMVKVWSLTDPAVQLSVILCTGLAPIAGSFGLLCGIAAGFIHSSVVLNVGTLYSALNLYNNGFSTGLVATILVPAILAVKKPAVDHVIPPTEE